MSRITDPAQLDGSLPAMIAAEFIEQHGIDAAHDMIDEMLDQFSVVELAAHDYDWRNFWARPKQNPPDHDDWESFGYLSGRGNGKTLSDSKIVNEEVEAGRAPLVCLIAQDEQSSIELHITGPSGLIATAPPWFKPVFHVSDLQLVWPNGSTAYVRTPEVPDKIRGLEYHLTWASELQSWPKAKLKEAWMNVQLSTRLGLARILWDATAKKRHPLLKDLLKDGKELPRKHVVRRGSTYENALNLARGYIERIERKYPPTTRAGQEELFARLYDDADGATAQAKWIKKRPKPERYSRKAVGLDVAVTNNEGSDNTGIVLDALGVDGMCYALQDKSGKYTPDEWAKIVIDLYVSEHCDCVVIETNKGGALVTQNLRTAARARSMTVIVLGKDEESRFVPDVIYVREVFARGEKADRAKPVGTAYEGGLIVHVEGADLTELEDILTTWVPAPGERSPDRLDAHVHAATELLGLSKNPEPDAKVGFVGINEMSAAITKPAASASKGRDLATMLGGIYGGRGGRI